MSTFNKKKKTFITVSSIVDLNLIQGADIAQTNSNVKTFGLLCCTSGPLSATVRIPRYGYTPGEVIPISAEIENLSDKKMNFTKARLFQDVVFSAKNGTKSTTRILQVIEHTHLYKYILYPVLAIGIENVYINYFYSYTALPY